MHSFLNHSFIHAFIHSFIIHALVVTIAYVQIACPTLPGAHNLPRTWQTKKPPTQLYKFRNRLGFGFKVQKVRLIGGRKEYEHHTHPPTHPPTHSFVALDDVMILCATTLPYKCNRPPCMIYLHVRGSSSSSSRPRFTLIYIRKSMIDGVFRFTDR